MLRLRKSKASFTPSDKNPAKNGITVRTVVLVALTLCCLSLLSFAQVTSGNMFGVVQDPSGAVISGAKVTAHADAIGVTRTVTTNDSGEFAITNLPNGNYTLTVEMQGFQTVNKEGVILAVGDRLNAGHIALPVNAAGGQVTVTADAGQLQLQSNSGERSDEITSRQLNDVALNGRNPLDYLKLVPGVSGMVDAHASGTGGLDSFNINGTRANEHEYTIDGASNVDTGNNGGTHITINPDAVEEMKILTSNYQAEYGKAGGGQIALTTKSGTNEWHGNGRFFHRHEGLNANEYFNKQSQLANNEPNTPPLYRYNYAGYSIGGPIIKNKVFVFWNQEYYNQLFPWNNIQMYVPTQLERQGDFSQSFDGNGNPVQISGPGITNNRIDPSALSPAQQQVYSAMQKIISQYPLPNVPGFGTNGNGYNFSETPSWSVPRREDILRVDWQINDANRLYGRWTYNHDKTTAPYVPFPGPFGTFSCSAPLFIGTCTQDHPGWNFSVNLVSTITPTLLNELSLGPSHTLSRQTSTSGNTTLSGLGISLPLLYPSDTIPDVNFGGMNNVNFNGPYLGATPWFQANTTINANDNVTWSHGKHIFKGGVFYQRNRKDQISWGNINGQFNFSSDQTNPSGCDANVNACGDPIASALLGEFQSADQSTARPTGKFRYNQVEFFIQDTWKLTTRFTLDYGMRFAYIPPQYDASNQVALFDPAAYDPAKAVHVNPDGSIAPNSGDPLDGMVFASNGTLPKGGWDSRGIMPEPRVGFAWDLFDDHKTVLRGGFGMTHDRVQGNLIYNPVFANPAIVQTVNLAAGNITDLSGATVQPSGTLSNIVGAAPNGKVPTIYSYSLGVQHEFGAGTTLDLSYVGTASRHLVRSYDINAIPYGYAFTKAAQDPANYAGGVVPDVQPNLPAEYAAAGFNFDGTLAYGRGSYTDAPLVPYKGYGQIPYLNWDGTSNYNSLQASFQRRFSKGLTFGLVYTWSKSLTTATGDQDLTDPFNPQLDYRAASWDRTHVFAANYVWDIPGVTKHFGGPHWLSYITDNYELSGITNIQSGTPVDTGNGWSYEHGALTGSNMWGAIQYYNSFTAQGTPIAPGIGLPWRGTRDILREGGLQTWDMSLFKNIPIKEHYSLQLRLEAFNAFNHPNFATNAYGVSVNGPWQWQPGTPISITQNANFGTPTSTYGSAPGGFRVVQLGAKFYF